MLIDILKLNKSQNSIEEFLQSVRQGVPSAVFGVNESFKCYLASIIKAPVLYVVKDIVLARKIEKQILEFGKKDVYVLPPFSDLLISFKGQGKDAAFQRAIANYKLSTGGVCIAPIEALLQPAFKNASALFLEKNKEYDIFSITKSLASMGYSSSDRIENKGTFSRRGDILDVFPIDAEMPVRLDFFGDTLESLKVFDLEDGKTLNYLSEINISSATPLVFSEKDLENFKDKANKERKRAEIKGLDKLKIICDDALDSIEKKDFFSLLAFSTLSENYSSVFELLPKDTVVILDEAKALSDVLGFLETEFIERFNQKYLSGEVFSFAKNLMLEKDELISAISKFNRFDFSGITSSSALFSPLKIISPKVNRVPDYAFRLKDLAYDVKAWLSSGYEVLVAAGSEENAEKIYFELTTENIPCQIGYNSPVNAVNILSKSLTSGFIFHEEKFVIVGSGNVYVKRKVQRRKSAKASFFTAPVAGDYAVHETHGVGRVLGNKKITSTEGTKDYVAVEYHGGDIVYVPVEQLDVLSRYLGAGKPALSKLGGDFSAVKKRVRESIKKMSFDLKNLYEERNLTEGFSFKEDQELKTLFESGFPYDYTPDQATAMEEVFLDMKSDKVMDRLICGDVGFGKTEVAFSAVFLAITNGKQAALLAPTTILTEQHYQTAKERFKNFGVKIALLNRFKTEKEAERILKDLKEKKIDFIIGTHRLLGKGVEFSDLGLLVLDEEQRFGVEHKEKIKLLKKNVDTLTLSATPIPRTLHMSLSGIRQISVINTPPEKRLPVQTYVTEESDDLIIDAVKREINRGGQAFILYNRIESIYNFSERIKRLLPSIKFTVLHGRMEERVLENGITEFYKGESQVLISTTIIENGIDLPRANTLIVIDADRLGLSTLYQLKGRVGRSDRLAFAYFTFKRDKVLTEGAYERLNAIIEFTEMGSGIKIAMRDLEIRGAGNVLGKEQHGHMDKIGYELYSKLLREELYGEEKTLELDVRVNAFIPETYIESNSARMDVYKEIAEADGEERENEIRAGLISAYGAIPKETENLIIISTVKRIAKKFRASKITVSKNSVNISFDTIKDVSNKKLMLALDSFKDKAFLSVSRGTRIEFIRNKEDSGEEMLKNVKKFLILADGQE